MMAAVGSALLRAAAGPRQRGPLPAVNTDPPLPHPDLLAAIPRLRRYARVLTGDANRADDIVQETLARGWEKRRLWAARSLPRGGFKGLGFILSEARRHMVNHGFPRA